MHRRILNLAIPSIIANITTPLLGLVDTAIVGHMGSPVFIAAIAVGGVMFNVLYWLFGFLRGGTSGPCAQSFGAKDWNGCRLVLRRSLTVAAIVGMIMVLWQQPLLDLLCVMLEPDAVTEPLARTYFSIVIFGAPAMLGSYALGGWFLGMQNSRMLMYTSMAINVINIAASLILVYVLDLGIVGVASGTLIAQWAGCAIFLIGVAKRWPSLRQSPSPSSTVPAKLSEFFKVNFNFMLRTVCMIAVTLWFTRTGAAQGAVILAVNSLLIQLFMLFSYIMDGFAFAGEALVGRFVGAQDPADLKQCVKALFQQGTLMALLFTVIYFLLGEAFLSILSNDHDVLLTSRDYFLWAVTVPFAGFAAFVWDGIYIGATLSKELVITTGLATMLFFGLLAIFGPTMGNHALWLAFITYLAARGLFQCAFYNRLVKKSTSS